MLTIVQIVAHVDGLSIFHSLIEDVGEILDCFVDIRFVAFQ